MENGYTKSALIQWFGEVSSENGVPPKTQMGDGILPPAPKAAHMLTVLAHGDIAIQSVTRTEVLFGHRCDHIRRETSRR